jgi:hypothetical protein
MNLWIVTIGSSDVQLDSDKTNQAKGRAEKQRSDKVWSYWYTDDLKAQYHDISFEPKPLFKDREEAYRIAPRILGAVYTASSESVQQEIWDYLTFPLLDNFVQALADYPAPEAIAILLTDQSTILPSGRQRQSKSPYWQDTRELKPILQRYFTDRFPGVPWEFVFLKPESQAESLDNWNAVLELVRNQFRTLKIEAKAIQIAPDEFVYVSHQAGTPAISSAVQFCSLAQFGDRVKFLVSSEQDKTLTDTVESSAYLRGIKKEQAKKLLDRYDYAGVNELLKDYLDSETKVLLDAAIQWNFAEFSKFKDKLKEHPQFTVAVESRTKWWKAFIAALEERTKEENWWWIAYEAAYLGVVRLEQENTVEALFHSFRAVEGLVSQWAIVSYPDDIDNKDGMPVARLKEPSKLPKFLLDEFGKLNTEKPNQTHEIKLYGWKLFTLLQETKTQLKDNEDIKTLCKSVKDKRNQFFHRLKGLDQPTLFQAWGMNSRDSWEKRLLTCLKLISDQTQFNSLKKASLMAQVHRELINAIAQL